MDRRSFLRAAGGAAAVTLAARWSSSQEGGDGVPRHYLSCYTHRLDMERGFKFHCLAPRATNDAFGEHEYAGFATVRVGDEPWMFVGDVPPVHGLVPEALGDLNHGRFSIIRQTDHWRVELFADWNAMYPATWLSARVEVDADAPITGGLMGWGWAERTIATQWFADGGSIQRKPGGDVLLARSEWIAYYDANGPFTGVLAFSEPPQRLWADDDGLYWEWGHALAGQTGETPKVAYVVAPGLLSPEDMARLAKALRKPPADFAAGVMPGEEATWIVIADEAEAAPVPPSLAPLHLMRDAVISVPTVAGEMLLAPGTGYSLGLPVPPELERPLPEIGEGGAIANEVAQHVTEVLAHRLADGRFEFGQGRTFYDGITCGVLAQVLPALPERLRGETADAVGGCLDTLCGGHVRSDAYGLLVPPELPSFIETGIDYPEITATLLYAILAYSLNGDREYASRQADLIETHYQQIGEMTTPEGLSWARADTEHMHLIAESAIGGYIAWASLYHLGGLLARPWATECRARAALAWTGYRQLFRWRPEYGETGVVNGWSNWRAETHLPEPWAFVQSTWFSFVPFVPYEREDRYNIWRSLREQPWWEWTGALESRQRCYDYANALALARAGHTDEVRAHLGRIVERPFWWNYFDATPVMAIAALPQLAALGVAP